MHRLLHPINFKVFLPLRLLSTIFLIAQTYSCQGQETKNDVEEKIDSSKPKKEEHPTFVYNSKTSNSKKHSTLNGIISEFVWQIHQDKNENYWFGTNHDGVLVYDNQALTQYSKKDGIGGNAVRAIIEDKKGTIWLGTSDGLTSYNGNAFTNYTTNDGLVNNEIWALEIDDNGIIWIGTVGGVSKFDGTNFETFKVPKPEVPKPEPMLSENRVSDILADKKGSIWFVNDGYGITKYDGSQFEFFTTENGLTDNNVADLFEDSYGNIWIGTFYGGVSRLDSNTFSNFTKEGVIEGVETYNFCEDRAGNIWFSAENHGVYRYDGKAFTQFTMEEGLATNTIQSIYEDHKGQIWFSTWEGISLYDGKTITNVSDKEPWTK